MGGRVGGRYASFWKFLIIRCYHIFYISSITDTMWYYCISSISLFVLPQNLFFTACFWKSFRLRSFACVGTKRASSTGIRWPTSWRKLVHKCLAHLERRFPSSCENRPSRTSFFLGDAERFPRQRPVAVETLLNFARLWQIAYTVIFWHEYFYCSNFSQNITSILIDIVMSWFCPIFVSIWVYFDFMLLGLKTIFNNLHSNKFLTIRNKS